jgi:hypothetical protein
MVTVTLRLFLGTHHPGWIWNPAMWDDDEEVPLFVSHMRLRQCGKLWEAVQPWALDSGAYSMLKAHGKWLISPLEYVNAVLRYEWEIGGIEWAATQDWMCEPFILAKTGLSVRQHQELTVRNYFELERIWGEKTDLLSPFVPPVQGYTIDQYRECVGLYLIEGLNLMDAPLVTLGSVCRRQGTQEIKEIVTELSPLKLHGFGVKQKGFDLYRDLLVSADSMAWSFAARKSYPMPGHEYQHINCANCIEYAKAWYTQLLTGEDMELPERNQL